MPQAQVHLPLWRDLPFVLDVQRLTPHPGVEGLAFEVGQHRLVEAICDRALLAATADLDVPA